MTFAPDAKKRLRYVGRDVKRLMQQGESCTIITTGLRGTANIPLGVLL